MDVQALINIDVDQFYGIEIEEFPHKLPKSRYGLLTTKWIWKFQKSLVNILHAFH